jgi:hypothetical protein
MRRLTLIGVLVVVATSTVATASAQAQTLTPVPAPPPSTHTIRAFGFFKIVGCVLGVATFVAGNTVLVLKIKKVGGILKFAKRLWQARNAEQRVKLVYQTLGTLSGVTGFVAACTP